MVSGQVSLYPSEIPVVPLGAVKVCVMVLSPLVGVVAPIWAHQLPPWQPELTAVSEAPEEVQPESEPASNPPLVMPPPLLAAVTVNETLAVCVAEEPVPVTVTLYVATALPCPTVKDSVE